MIRLRTTTPQLHEEDEKAFFSCDSDSVSIITNPFNSLTFGGWELRTTTAQPSISCATAAAQIAAMFSLIEKPLYSGIIFFLLVNGAAYPRGLSRVLNASEHQIRFRMNELAGADIIISVPFDDPATEAIRNFYQTHNRMEKKNLGKYHFTKMQFYALMPPARAFYTQIQPVLEERVGRRLKLNILGFQEDLMKTNAEAQKERDKHLAQCLDTLRKLRHDTSGGYELVDGKKIPAAYTITLRNDAKRLGMTERELEAML